MEIGKVIKKARLNKKITQEELAIAVGVTTQAVSRWETEVSYPDITLLPTISNYLDVTSDELLGIKLYEREENIDKILKENAELNDTYRLEESMELLKNSLKQYPNDERLLNALSRCYWNTMMMTKGKDNLIEYRQELKKLIIENATKILEIAKDPEIIETAKLNLISTYPRLGEEGRLKALEIVNTLPSIYFSKELQLASVLSNDDKKVRVQENVLLLLQLINNNFSYRLIEFFDCLDEKIDIMKKNIEVIKIIVGEELKWFNIPCSNYSFKIAEMYAQKKDRENTLKYLNDSACYAYNVCIIPKEGEYDTYYLKGLKYKISKSYTFGGNVRSLDDSVFDFVKDTDEFKKIKEKYIETNKLALKQTGRL